MEEFATIAPDLNLFWAHLVGDSTGSDIFS